MAKIQWDAVGERSYEAGVDRGVLYPEIGPGLAWNGLLGIVEKDNFDGVETVYYDGLKYRRNSPLSTFTATIKAFTYPDAFDAYNGIIGGFTAQRRRMFGLSYRTLIGNDILPLSKGYRIHLVYNALISPGENSWKSLQEAPDPNLFQWPIITMPIIVDGVASVSHLVIDSNVANSETLSAVESIIYGTETTNPRLPSPNELLSIFAEHAALQIVDHGDGTWTATGPDDMVNMLDINTFLIDSPSVVYLDEDTYRVSNW